MPTRKGSIPWNKGKKRPLAERFWSHVEKTDGCWLWKGGGDRYGIFDKRGAHRVSWKLANGKSIPKGMEVCHHCDNGLCVRPDHLFLGTQSDNLIDCSKKGRITRNKAILTPTQVLEIREIYKNKGIHQQDRKITFGKLAEQFHISKREIRHIIRRESWKYL